MHTKIMVQYKKTFNLFIVMSEKIITFVAYNDEILKRENK